MERDTSGVTAFTLRLPNDLDDRIRIAAAKERKSRHKWIVEAVELVVSRVEKQEAENAR